MDENLKESIGELAEAYKKYKKIKGGILEVSLPSQVIEKDFTFAGTVVTMKGEQMVLEMIADKLNS